MRVERIRGRGAWVDRVAEVLGARVLRWVGPRGADSRALRDVPQLGGAISLTAQYGDLDAVCLESLVGRRVDLDAYDSKDPANAGAEASIWEAVDAVLDRPSVLLPYRAYHQLIEPRFCRRSTTSVIGMFPGLQDVFDYKPFVESELGARGVAVLPWRYVRRADLESLRAELDNGPIVLRRDRTSGGSGFWVVRCPEELDLAWPEEGPSCLAATGLLHEPVSLNVGGVVWSTTTTLHPASVQLIGVAGLTAREFGYCGNDFAAIGLLDRAVLDDLEDLTLRVADWLRIQGYRGAFGVDALWHEGQVLFMEVNPRFQGSSVGSSMLSTDLDLPCIYLEHLGVFLGFSPPPARRLYEMWSSAPPLGAFTVHHVRPQAALVDVDQFATSFANGPGFRELDLLPSTTTMVDEGGAIARVFANSSITTTGADLNCDWRSQLDLWRQSFLEPA